MVLVDGSVNLCMSCITQGHLSSMLCHCCYGNGRWLSTLFLSTGSLQASQCGTEKIDEDELLNLVRTRPAKKSKRAAPPSKKGAPKKTAKQRSPPVSEPLTPKSHAIPKSQVTATTQDHASNSVGMTSPQSSHVTTPVSLTTEGKFLCL